MNYIDTHLHIFATASTLSTFVHMEIFLLENLQGTLSDALYKKALYGQYIKIK